ncbi:MAG: imidazole glycerol phosphate synthase subunit HisH [Bdellovibrionota bacterium]
MKVSLVDYGRGNLGSVRKAFEHVGAEVEVISAPAQVDRAEALVLPGQGAFKDCMLTLDRGGLSSALRKYLASGRPYLGLCLGLQILFEWSEEHGGAEGLGVLKGKVRRFPVDLKDVSGNPLKVPHMGWNGVRFPSQEPFFAGIPEETAFYFVHSYYVDPTDSKVACGRTDYGIDFVSAIRSGPWIATQFHPEKSQRAGLALISNFYREAQGKKSKEARTA